MTLGFCRLCEHFTKADDRKAVIRLTWGKCELNLVCSNCYKFEMKTAKLIETNKMFDVVLCRIFNMEVDDYGRPFTICQKHLEGLRSRLSKECIVQVMALLPINNVCSHCEQENKE